MVFCLVVLVEHPISFSHQPPYVVINPCEVVFPRSDDLDRRMLAQQGIGTPMQQ